MIDWFSFNFAKLLLLIFNVYISLLIWHTVQHKSSHTKPRNKRVLLVIAHPDDECMFFGPTIINLAANGSDLRVLALTNGNYEGLGDVRQRELLASCAVLGVVEASVRILHDLALPDHPTERWALPSVAAHVRTCVLDWDIATVITFDRYGISGHINHISTHYGVRQALGHGWGVAHGVQALELTTVGLVRKYLGPLDMVISAFGPHVCWVAPARLRAAMRQHASQLLWYRRLYVLFSRYMYVNTLRPMGL